MRYGKQVSWVHSRLASWRSAVVECKQQRLFVFWFIKHFFNSSVRVHYFELLDLGCCGPGRGSVGSCILLVRASSSPMTGVAAIHTKVVIATSVFFVVANWSSFLTSELSLIICVSSSWEVHRSREATSCGTCSRRTTATVICPRGYVTVLLMGS